MLNFNNKMKYMALMVKFIKMHGIGNDFVILDCRDGKHVSHNAAKEISDRKFGVGCDQIIVIKKPVHNNDILLEFRNSDGSIASACGNGTRCVAGLILEETSKDKIKIETKAGILEAWKDTKSGFISVNMGKPNFQWNEIPLLKNIDHKKVFLGDNAPGDAFCLSMGNPHAVFFVSSLAEIDVDVLGPIFENHSIFPEKANISFAQVLSKSKIKMKVWERGVGITKACGSGACAVAVAAKQLSKIGSFCEISLDGGKLNVHLPDNDNIYLTGPIEISFRGELSQRLSNLIK